MAKNKRIIWIITALFGAIIISLFFSYRLLDVPTGLTVDESDFGYNAAIISHTGRDENNRLLPIFAITKTCNDWRQPVTQYFLVILFKIFGPSVWLLRFSSIIITISSTFLLFYLTKKLLGKTGAIFSTLIFLTTPLIMIQSHMGLDNIMVIPFTILWLIFVYLHEKTGHNKFLIFAAISLGIGFYTYKGMRATVPVWCVLTVLYLFHKSKYNLKKSITPILYYSLSFFPFIAIIPLLQWKYPGAVFDRQGAVFDTVYNFIYPYISSYDPGFLFIKGDALLFHSTQTHGMMLLSTLPLFLIGIYQAIKKNKFWAFITLAFFTAPLLYGFVNSVHRASRLMVIIPLFTLLTSLGALYLWQHKNKLLGRLTVIAIGLLAIVNYSNFLNYYWYTYPKFTENIFGHMTPYKSYAILAKEAKNRNLKPYIANGVSENFFRAIYFPDTIEEISSEVASPPGSILMTFREHVPDMELLDVKMPKYHLQVRY